jgi:AraC-like DNA-binding protein
MMLPSSVRIASQDEMGTRLGRARTMGFVDHGPALLPRPRRVLDAYALVLVHHGVGSYVDDAVPHLPIAPGDTILTVPGHSHWYGPRPGGTWSETFLVFDGPIFDAMAAGGVLDAGDPVRRVEPLEAWRTRLQEFADRTRPNTSVARELEILELAALLVELRGGADDAGPMARPIRRARELLVADLSSALDLHDVAAAAGLPYETFRKKFRGATGRSPAAFRLDRRIEAAQALLRMTTMTHAAIAASLGFADENHFAKRFRARVGTSPKQYRRANTARSGAGTPSAGPF